MVKQKTKAYLQSLVHKANEEDKRRPNESETDRMKRLLIKSSVDSICENVEFFASLGNMFYKVENLNKELLLDIYDGVKLILPDCKIYVDLDNCSFVIHWGM